MFKRGRYTSLRFIQAALCRHRVQTISSPLKSSTRGCALPSAIASDVLPVGIVVTRPPIKVLRSILPQRGFHRIHTVFTLHHCNAGHIYIPVLALLRYGLNSGKSFNHSVFGSNLSFSSGKKMKAVLVWLS